jgi:hypothetical protein
VPLGAHGGNVDQRQSAGDEVRVGPAPHCVLRSPTPQKLPCSDILALKHPEDVRPMNT